MSEAIAIKEPSTHELHVQEWQIRDMLAEVAKQHGLELVAVRAATLSFRKDSDFAFQVTARPLEAT